VRGAVELGGRPVDLGSIDCPVVSVVGEADHIVPPGATQPIMDVLPDVEELRFPAGHVGLIVGKSAQRTTIPAIAAWLLAHCDEETVPA
jgi:polyhydroxyalkanoate synthase